MSSKQTTHLVKGSNNNAKRRESNLSKDPPQIQLDN